MLTSTMSSSPRQTATCMPTSGLPAKASRAAAATIPPTSAAAPTGTSPAGRGSATAGPGPGVGLQLPAVQLEVRGVRQGRYPADDLGDLVAGQPRGAERAHRVGVQLTALADDDRGLDALPPGVVEHAVDARVGHG